jgi:hypothetical protein
MFSEPLNVTINAVAKGLSRVTLDGRTGSFERAADGLSLKISHTIKKRASRMVRLDRTVLRADPLTGLQVAVTDNVWLVYNAPIGTTVPLAEQKHMMTALGDLVKDTAFQDKFLNGEA